MTTSADQRIVLVVEDSEDHRYLTRIFLEQIGCHVVEAVDGEQAVTLALSEHPDIILMDIGLPHVDGYEATRRIRQHPETEGVKIIAYTAIFDEKLIERATSAGFDEYILKPPDFSRMEKLINRLMPMKIGGKR